MNEQVQKIRAEIVRRMNAVNSTLLNEKYDDLLCFIDSLPDEKPSKDLETVIATWLPKHIRVENKDYEYLKKPLAEWAGFIARHFAKWGAEHQVIDGNKMIEPSKDLEEDVQMEWDSFNKHIAEYGDEVVWLNWLSFVDIATYFYELGLNARKEE